MKEIVLKGKERELVNGFALARFALLMSVSFSVGFYERVNVF